MPVGCEHAAQLAQPRREEAEVVVERVAVGGLVAAAAWRSGARRSRCGRRRRRADGRERAAGLGAAGVERRVGVGHLRRCRPALRAAAARLSPSRIAVHGRDGIGATAPRVGDRRRSTVRRGRMIARVEPLTTTRRLSGPFDYALPRRARVDVGSIVRDAVRAPEARRRRGRAGGDERAAARAARGADGGARATSCPPDLVELALWMADEYCSTPARALALVLPPPGRPRTALWARARPARRDGERLTDNQRALLGAAARARRPATSPALRRLEAARAGRRSRSARAAARRARTPRPTAPVELTRGQQATRSPRSRRGGRAPAARRHRLGQDRGLPARRRRGARARRGRDRARARDRADAADRRALPGALRRHRRAAALGARRGRALRRVAAAAHRRGADRGRPALGRLRAGRATSAWSSSTRSTTRPTSTRATRATTRASVAAERARRTGARAARRLRDAAAGDLARARRTWAARAGSTRGRCRPCACSTCAARTTRCTPRRAARWRARASRSCCSTGAAGRTSSPAARAGRRGSARSCDVALVLHRAEHALACHHCGHRERVPEPLRRAAARSPSPATAPAPSGSRPSCASALDVPVFRLDADTAGAKDAVPELLARFARRARRAAARHADGRQGPRLPGRRRSASCSTPTRRCASPTSAPRSARSR